MIFKTPMKVGNIFILKTVEVIEEGARLVLQFPYNPDFLSEVKLLEGAKWHGFETPPRKVWSIANSEHNWFRIQYWKFLGSKDPKDNPYARYDRKPTELNFHRPLRAHQREMVSAILTYREVILGAEMGLGKTLCFIEAAERARMLIDQDLPIWYVGPKAGVKAINLELRKWRSDLILECMTYEQLVKKMKNWDPQDVTPFFVCFDEGQRIKTPSSQRSQAAKHLTEAMRKEHDFCFIIDLTGTPAPKSPMDWWNQCHIVRPGFLKEGNIHKFQEALCITEKMTGDYGDFKKIVTWLDDPLKCKVCGQLAEDHDNFTDHGFCSSENKVSQLYNRMKGLVTIKMKKDCLDLPDKIYERVQLTPPVEMIRAAKLVASKATRAVEALALLRELSDGFQYDTVATDDTTDCPICHGSGQIMGMIPFTYDTDENDMPATDYVEGQIECSNCNATGQVSQYKRIAREIGTPKDEYLIDLLDEHEDIGRLIVWCGFTASVDRVCQIALDHGWHVLRVDGRGFKALGTIVSADTLLEAMDRSNPACDKYQDKICFVGHPKAGGLALTLTASPTALYYSNDFSGEARMQSEDRFHRIGMAEDRGARIIDLITLPVDIKVLDNLQQKKDLQAMSMGELKDLLL